MKLREKYRAIKLIKRNIISTSLIAVLSLFIGLMIIYIIFHLIPGDPIAATLEARVPHYTLEQYVIMANLLGFEYNPLLDRYILRFTSFLGHFFNADWKWSVSVIPNAPVLEIVFANGTFLQVVLLFAISLIIGVIFMILKSREKSILFHTLVFEGILVAAFSLHLLFSDLFNIRGFGKLLIDAIEGQDHFLINGCLFLTLIIFVLTPLVSNIIFSIYKSRISKTSQIDLEANSSGEINSEEKL